ELVALGADDHRVREHEEPVAAVGLRVVADIDGDEPHRLADLRRREADTSRLAAHRVEQVRRDPVELRPGRDLRAALLEERVRVADDRPLGHGYRTSPPAARTETSTPCSSATRASSASSAASSTPSGSATSSSIT